MKVIQDDRVMAITKHCVALAIVFCTGLAAAGDIRYNRDIRPILSDNCFACHGPDKNHRKGKLRLDERDAAIAKGAIVPGKPQESELIARLNSADSEEVMPPPESHKKLSAAQKELLKQWIAGGAPYEPHWAYMKIVRPAVPAVKDASRARNPIDAFIQQALADKNLKPAPEADRRTLLRRLSLDIIGLPPTPEESDAFVADKSPDAYEKQLQRLLGSPRYGERMAQQWLDLARYADSVGFHGDQYQNAWAFRDYVIDAFNSNKPFDQFTIEQLAGDLLPNPTDEQLVASCFNRLNMMTREGGAQPKEYLAKYTADRIRTVGTTWMGSTLGCCECHDHKFDPFKAKDFYAIGAFFGDIKQWGVYHSYGYTPEPELAGWSNDHPFPPEIKVKSAALERRIEEVQAEAKALASSLKPAAPPFEAWQRGIAAHLTANPGAWAVPTPEVAIAHPAPPKKPANAKKKDAGVKSGQGEPKEPPPPPDCSVGPDGLIVFEKSPAREARIDLKPTHAWVATLKFEVLPHEKHKNSIVRSGNNTTVKPQFSVIQKDGKTRKLSIRHAQADLYAPRYSKGEEVIGLTDGWKTDAKFADKPHTAFYVLDTPVQLGEGESLRVQLPDNNLSSLRLSTSPLAPRNLGSPAFPANLREAFNDPALAAEYYLRSTAWDAKAFSNLKLLDRKIIGYRGGITPVMVSKKSDKPLTIRVLPRGNWQDESGEVCQPATPHFLPALPDASKRTLNRLDLAKWLLSADNPLTARVIMNRLWKQFFGNGLSLQVDDLGAQGEQPSHPELLDWLSVEFREKGWDTKHMVKLIASSHTYRQMAGLRPEVRESDPLNRLLSAQNPRRLEAEFVRDNALAIAGLINFEMGGPPSKPYQPGGYYADIQFPDRDYNTEKDNNQWRRGVYMWWQRTFLHPMLLNFDAPSREDCIAIRTSANTPQQALTLLNDPTFVEAARAWALRILSAQTDDAARIDLAYRQALSRLPSAAERDSLLVLLAAARGNYQKLPADAAALLKIGIAPAAHDNPVELAAWTSVCRVILNLHETITRY